DRSMHAAPGGYGPTDEEGCRAGFPTFISRGAIGLGTYRIQGGVGHLAAQVLIFRSHAGTGFEPLWSRLARHLSVARLDTKQFASFSLRDRRHGRLLESVLGRVVVPDDVLTRPPGVRPRLVMWCARLLRPWRSRWHR